jgi:hypothetical protein
MNRLSHAFLSFGICAAFTLSCALWLPIPPGNAAFHLLTFLIAYVFVFTGPIALATVILFSASAFGLILLLAGAVLVFGHIITNKFDNNPWLQQALYFAWFAPGTLSLFFVVARIA